MGGRNAKPIELHLLEGNPNRLTKKQIKERKDSEVKLGERKITCPDFVKNDVVALKKWKEILKIYAKSDLVSSADEGLLGRYCKTYSEYQDLLRRRDVLTNMEGFDTEEEEDILEILEDQFGKKQSKDIMINKVLYILSMSGLLAIEKAINSKMDMLIKMEDRLFLNPLAKVKNVPKKEPPKEATPFEREFGNI